MVHDMTLEQRKIMMAEALDLTPAVAKENLKANARAEADGVSYFTEIEHVANIAEQEGEN